MNPILFKSWNPMSMKKSSLILFLALFFQIAVQAQTNSSKQTTLEIHQLIQESFDSLFSAYQANLVERYYTPDFILLEQGEVWDMDFIKSYLSERSLKNNLVRRTNRFEFIKTEIFGDRAWVAYHNYATFTKEGEAPREVYWLESAAAIKTDNGWRLELLHSTRAELPKK
jgi:ketosteroid isomerase-like protein